MKTTLTPDEIRERYNNAAGQYRERGTGLKGEYYRRFEDDLFLRHVDFRDKRVLDLGTGRGRLAVLVADQAREVVGIDLSDEMIRAAREAIGPRTNIRFELANASHLAFPDGAFDVVVSAGMFPYVRDVAPFFAEIHRVLVPGGDFVFTAFNAREWRAGPRLYAALRGARLAPRDPALMPHEPAALEDALAGTGFETRARRSTFFFLPSRVFYWAGRRGLTAMQAAAARANELLGSAPVTRDHGQVLVMFARRPAA